MRCSPGLRPLRVAPGGVPTSLLHAGRAQRGPSQRAAVRWLASFSLNSRHGPYAGGASGEARCAPDFAPRSSVGDQGRRLPPPAPGGPRSSFWQYEYSKRPSSSGDPGDARSAHSGAPRSGALSSGAVAPFSSIAPSPRGASARRLVRVCATPGGGDAGGSPPGQPANQEEPAGGADSSKDKASPFVRSKFTDDGFFNRDEETCELWGMLRETPGRIIVLTGPPNCGKSVSCFFSVLPCVRNPPHTRCCPRLPLWECRCRRCWCTWNL